MRQLNLSIAAANHAKIKAFRNQFIGVRNVNISCLCVQKLMHNSPTFLIDPTLVCTLFQNQNFGNKKSLIISRL